MVMGMASEIKRGEAILIPFINGKSIYDSQCKPRMHKTVQAFEKSFPGHYLGTADVELVEYAEVVRCKDCVHYDGEGCLLTYGEFEPNSMDFCSYGERRNDG